MRSILDLLEAITDVRVKNPELRTAVLASLRLAIGESHCESGRLYSLDTKGRTIAIISQGDADVSEEADAAILTACRMDRDHRVVDDNHILPLGRDGRLYGVLILVKADPRAAEVLANLFLQWSAVAEFLNLEKAELIDENFQLREEIKLQFLDTRLIGNSGAFRHVVESGLRVAASNASVLICGETGTGKEVLAHLIHAHSPRANNPFITVNCGALADSLLETELFGHVKGAFTGAIADHKGRFEVANNGTIFLDEIGEVSPAMQVRLLRVLQEMEIVRVGDYKTRKLDVRVIAATNRNLEEEVAAGNFRTDLFYRLNVVQLTVPPLRQRPEDIPPLVEHFLSIYCQRNCKYIASISRQGLEIMREYPWPGNVRELENCIEKMVVMATGDELTADLLPMALMAYHTADVPQLLEGPNRSFEEMLKVYMQAETERCLTEGGGLYERIRNKWERFLFETVLKVCKNNKSKTARLLGITRNTLNARLEILSETQRVWKDA